MSMAAPKRLWAQDRPRSVDPSLVTRSASASSPATATSASRPPFSSLSSFSSSITSVFTGSKHSRSVSQSSSHLTRPASTVPVPTASATPTQKWIPRATTPGAPHHANQPSRHRSTSSASAAAAALSTPTEPTPPSVPPLPIPTAARSSPALPNAGSDEDQWAAQIRHAAIQRYRQRVKYAEYEMQKRLRAAIASEGLNSATVSRSRRRDSSSSSSGSSNSSYEMVKPASGRSSEENRLKEEFDHRVARYRHEMEEEIKAATEERRRNPPETREKARGPLVEDEDEEDEDEDEQDEDEDDEQAEGGGGGDGEWIWRPDSMLASGGTSRAEQQAIWDAIKRNSSQQLSLNQHSSSAQLQQQAAAQTGGASAGRRASRVHFHQDGAGTGNGPTLPRTPHSSSASGSAGAGIHRPITAHPSTGAAGRPLSPAVVHGIAPGIRPGSARPASPAYTRWIPNGQNTAGNGTPSPTSATAGKGSNPIAIPKRARSNTNTGNGGGEGEGGSVGRTVSGSGGGSSWRDWNAAHGNGHSPSTPSGLPPSASAIYGRTPSSGNLHQAHSVYAAARTPSSGNLASAGYVHARTPSAGNLGGRRAMTPGPVSSASGYARQRTASSAGQQPFRVPSVPPMPSQERFAVSASARERERERERSRAKEVVDDRDREDPEPPARPQAPAMGLGARTGSLRARAAAGGISIGATQGLGSRTGSNRSALVEEDAPPPAEVAPAPAPAASRAHSQRSQHSVHNEDEEEEEEPVVVRKVDKGKGKAVDVGPAHDGAEVSFRRDHKNMMFGNVLDRYAMQLRQDLQITGF